MHLGERLKAIPDRYARRQGTFTLPESIIRIGSAREVWDFVRACGGRTFRVLYVCKDGRVRDIIGRQGVHNSTQDGKVRNVGAPMANAVRLTLSFWTETYGDKVNTGQGKGYRTLRAEGILALRVDGVTIVTNAGIEAIGQLGAE